ncbi:ABC transporter permease [Hazenella coriacea]|uniref:Oligopeptide transport system permease protein n=1 Tax=Hazenella coriacea TaxID=1179467 RepID=A0A4R3LCB3_9BACL|nr:ABC transporter permease [Hazenella coriacea]TCS96910.1 oligopeptide transport system permease protein [Hazenella coriacea]
MLRFTLKRFSYMIITLWVIATATFFLMHSLPGTPLQNEEKLPEAIKEQIIASYGLDQPLHIQYVKFLGQLVQGDLGKSLQYDGRPVAEMLMDGFGPSAIVGAQGIILGVMVGLLLGVVAGLKRGTIIDNFATMFSVAGVSIPSFVVGALLSFWIGVEFGWLPPALWGTYEHTILPSIALSLGVIAQISRYVRTEMVEVLDQDYMKTAKAKGLGKSSIVFNHALRNALIPAITILGPLTAGIITGSFIIELIFAIPGMGKYFIEAIGVRDYTMIMGATILYSALIVFMIFIVDILYGIIDPRIRVAAGKE